MAVTKVFLKMYNALTMKNEKLLSKGAQLRAVSGVGRGEGNGIFFQSKKAGGV